MFILRPRTFTLLALAALPVMPAAADPIAELRSGASSLRFALPDFIYASGVSADFSQLQVVDGERRNVEFAVCPQVSIEDAEIQVPALPVPSIARVGTDGTGALRLEFSPGARHPGTADEWLIDTRGTDASIHGLSGLPPISQVRPGPNLRQWSAPLDFVQDGDTVRFDPRPSPFFKVRLRQTREVDESAPQVTATLRRRQQARKPHWYNTEVGERGIYLNDRALPVIAARIKAPAGGQEWLIESRQGDWDAWKPRARIPAGEQNPVARFSAVTDPQWRINGDGVLELGHAAYEMRIPRLPNDQPVRILRLERGRFGPSLNCDLTENLPRQEPDELQPLQAASGTQRDYRDLRGGFLILLGIGLIVFWFWRRFRKPGRGR